MSDFSSSFALVFRELMRRNGVSGQQIADTLGVSPSKISSRLTGKRPIDTEMIYAAAELIGYTPREVVSAVIAGMEGDVDPELLLLTMMKDDIVKALWKVQRDLDKYPNDATAG